MSETPVILAKQKGLPLSELIAWLNEAYQREGDMPVMIFDAAGDFSNAAISNNLWLVEKAKIGKVYIEKAMVIMA